MRKHGPIIVQCTDSVVFPLSEGADCRQGCKNICGQKKIYCNYVTIHILFNVYFWG